MIARLRLRPNTDKPWELAANIRQYGSGKRLYPESQRPEISGSHHREWRFAGTNARLYSSPGCFSAYAASSSVDAGRDC
jgi:hypothetical protein